MSWILLERYDEASKYLTSPNHSAIMLEVDRAIRATLLHLEKILREAGDNASADKARNILQTPNHISALHQIFASNLKRTSRIDPASHERRLWFEDFSSRNGNCLGQQQLQKLAAITKHWALSEEKLDALISCSLLWSSCPRLFWDGKKDNADMIKRCLDDLERIREIDPLRRITILTILSEYVDSEQEQMRISGKRQRHRYQSKAVTQGAYRKKMLLPTSLRSIVGRLWPGAHPAERKKSKKMLSLYSRYGWKWQQVRPPGMILSLPDCAAKRFEKASWTAVEFEAINEFIKTLPQYRIRALLKGTMNCLVSHYNGKIQPNVLSRVSASTSNTRPIVDQQISTPGPPYSDVGALAPQMDATQGLGNSRLISSTIPAADLYSPVSAEVRSSSQSEQAANFQEPATPDTSEDTMGLTRSVYSASPITSSRRSDLTMNIPCHETCQMSSESQFETPPLPEATKASMTNDTTSGTHLRCFEISQDSQNTNLSSNQSDMMIFQPCVHPSHALQNTNETALYGREFNDTSLAMQGLYGGLSNIPIPEINDPMNAMHWFASQAEHYRRTVDSTLPNNAGAESGFRPLEPVLPNDTSLALFAIEPQTELNMTHPSFNDTSLTMSVFAPELLYYDERGFGTNCSQSVT